MLGVFVRSFDGMNDSEKPWLSCFRGWCANMMDFLSACLINRMRPRVFKSDGAGIVYQHEIFRDGILCGFDHDGGTWGKKDGGCSESTQWPWKPDEFKQLINAQHADTYNEIIVRDTFADSNVPDVIAAFFFPRGDDEDFARSAHRTFMHEYPNVQMPLVMYDQDSATEPFSLVPN